MMVFINIELKKYNQLNDIMYNTVATLKVDFVIYTPLYFSGRSFCYCLQP